MFLDLPRPFRESCGLHERRKGEGIACILDAEDAEEEAIHDEQSTAPCENSDTLGLRVGNSGDLDSEGNSCKAQDTICMLSVVVHHPHGHRNLHIAATIWVSMPNWFWKPEAK